VGNIAAAKNATIGAGPLIAPLVNRTVVNEARFNTEITPPQANSLPRVLRLAQAVCSTGGLPADALDEFTGSGTSTSYKNVMRGVYYYVDAARSIGLVEKFVDTDGRVHVEPTMYGAQFFTASEWEQKAALGAVVDQFVATDLSWVRGDHGAPLDDSTVLRREVCQAAWDAYRIDDFVGCLDNFASDDFINQAVEAGDARWTAHAATRRPVNNPAQARDGGVCGSCFTTRPVSGLCDTCD
jgi:hypothetical protein